MDQVKQEVVFREIKTKWIHYLHIFHFYWSIYSILPISHLLKFIKVITNSK